MSVSSQPDSERAMLALEPLAAHAEAERGIDPQQLAITLVPEPGPDRRHHQVTGDSDSKAGARP